MARIGSIVAVLASFIAVLPNEAIAASMPDTVTTDKSVVAVAKVGDDTKNAIKQDQDKIAAERNAIIADGKKLQEAKRVGDKAKMEEIRKGIEARKATIKSLKDDIYKRMGGGGEFAPSGKARGKEMK